MSKNSADKPARILIVDDEGIIAMDLKQEMIALGYDVCGTALSGEAALEITERERPDLVLMDIVLAGELDGIQAAEVIREKYHIPVVFITAYADQERLNKAKLTYPFGYILKPFQSRELVVTVEMALYIGQVEAERKKGEEALRGEALLNQILLDSFPCVALLLRPKTREIVALNKAAKEAGCLVGLSCFRTWAKFKEPCPWCLAESLWEEGRAQQLAIEALGVVWDAHWVPVSDDLYLHYAFDNTEQHRVQEALRESEKQFRALAETVNVIAWEFDLINDRWNYVTPQSQKILGYLPGEWKNFNWWAERIYEEDREQAIAFCKEETGKKADHAFEYRFLKKDGSVIWLQDIVHVILEKEVPVTLRGIMIEVTERKAAEEALNQKLAELERFNKLTVDRELRMVELKKEINALLLKAGEKEKYGIVE